jgi:hypothetical protein
MQDSSTSRMHITITDGIGNPAGKSTLRPGVAIARIGRLHDPIVQGA